MFSRKTTRYKILSRTRRDCWNTGVSCSQQGRYASSTHNWVYLLYSI